MTDDDADSAQVNINQTAETIFNLLYQHEGDMDLQDLSKKSGHPRHIFDMAIGTLVEKGDIELLPKGDSFMIHRAAPALAVFPLRGN